MNRKQQTISKEVSLAGPGLFSGEPATLTFLPAEAGQGITFVREQDGKVATIRALVDNVLKQPRRTCLKNGTLFVQTIEHCMAALAGMGVDNAVVKVSGGTAGEVPGGDGSSQPFVEKIQEAGVVEQQEELRPLIIKKPVQVTAGDATLAALPGPEDHLEVIYDFEAPAPVGRQVFKFQTGDDDFVTQLAPARTFVFEHEASELRARGLGQHLSPKDLLVIAAGGPIENKFRFADECARHKVLDLLGDLYLVGRPIRGRIFAHKSGHSLNHLLAKRLLEQEEASARTSMVTREAALDIRRIQRILPHRYPMLMVDRVLQVEGDHRAVGIKNVTFNDIFFQGHYPGTPIMPGVLIVEAMAQLGGILLSQKLEHTGKLAVLLSMDKVKMRHPVVPGDQLLLEAITVRVKSRTGHVRCKAFVGEKLACEADIKFMLVDSEPLKERTANKDDMSKISPLAVIDPSAKLAPDVEVGPFCVVGPHVTLGNRCRLIAHVSILGRTTIGAGNVFWPNCVIGGEPQDLKYRGEVSSLEIGDANQIREAVTVHSGTAGGGGVTRIGSNNLLMVNAHIGHDSTVGDRCVIANNVMLAGHVVMGNHVVMSAGAAAHHYVRIGDHVFIGAYSRVHMDVAPFVKLQDDTVWDTNTLGLQRSGFVEADIEAIDDAVRRLFISKKMPFAQAIAEFDTMNGINPHVKKLVGFLRERDMGKHGRYLEKFRAR